MLKSTENASYEQNVFRNLNDVRKLLKRNEFFVNSLNVKLRDKVHQVVDNPTEVKDITAHAQTFACSLQLMRDLETALTNIEKLLVVIAPVDQRESTFPEYESVQLTEVAVDLRTPDSKAFDQQLGDL